MIRERVKASVARARAQGKPLGRPRRAQSVHPHRQRPVVAAGHLTRAEAARKLSVSRATLDNALRAVRKGGAVPAAVGEISRAD